MTDLAMMSRDTPRISREGFNTSEMNINNEILTAIRDISHHLTNIDHRLTGISVPKRPVRPSFAKDGTDANFQDSARDGRQSHGASLRLPGTDCRAL